MKAEKNQVNPSTFLTQQGIAGVKKNRSAQFKHPIRLEVVLLSVVGADERGGSGSDGLQQFTVPIDAPLIEVRARFVQANQPGLGAEGDGELNALPHARAQGPQGLIESVRNPGSLQRLKRIKSRPPRPKPPMEGARLPNCQVRMQGRSRRHQQGLQHQFVPALPIPRFQSSAPSQHSARGLQRSRENPSEGGLPAPVRPANDPVLPGVERSRHALEHPPIAEPMSQILRLKRNGGHNGPRMTPLSLLAMNASTVSLSSLAGSSASAIFRAWVRLPFWT